MASEDALTLAIAGKGDVGCDVETVVEQPDHAWLGLLGKERFELARRLSDSHVERLNRSATRLWTALECLRKAGLPADAPLVSEAAAEDGWIILRSGTLLIATCVLLVQHAKDPLAFAIAFRPDLDGTDLARTGNPLPLIPRARTERIQLEGIIEGPARPRGFIFVGTFTRGFPQGVPDSGTVLLTRGKFRVKRPAIREFHLMAVLVPFTARLTEMLTTLPIGLVGSLRIQDFDLATSPMPRLLLRPLRLTDPPIVPALPALPPLLSAE